MAQCCVCGRTLALDIGFGNPNNYRVKDYKTTGNKACSEKCCNEYNRALLYNGGTSNTASNTPGQNQSSPSAIGSFLSNAMKSDEEKMAEQGLSGEEIAKIKAAEASADIERGKLALEKEKLKHQRADELRAQGKNTQAFFHEHGSTVVATLVVIFSLSIGVMSYYKYHSASSLDKELTRKSEHIDDLIRSGNYDEAYSLVDELQNDSDQDAKDHSKNLFSNYTYAEYWKMKRDGYKATIDSLRKMQVTQQQGPAPQMQQAPVQEVQQDTQTVQPSANNMSNTNSNIASVVVEKAYLWETEEFNGNGQKVSKTNNYLTSGQKVTIVDEKSDFYKCMVINENGSHKDVWMLKTDLKKD